MSDATIAREFTDLDPDPKLLGRSDAQGEFSLSPLDYISRLATRGNVSGGRARLEKQRAALDIVEGRTGVSRELIVAFWGLESGFGTSAGDHDVLRSLATLGALGPRRDFFRDECVAALAMIDRGDATRAQLKGSWAGATGQPQFMPSSYRKYAVPLAGAGPADIWRSPGDTLASIGNFMRQSGWAAGLPAALEVRIPAGFDWRPTDLPLPQWAALGFAQADGKSLPTAGTGNLFLPAGSRGPALLLTENFEAIRAYNTSDAYALAVFVLAERIAGRPGLVTPWPPDGPRLTASSRRAVQERLRAKGFYSGVVDGRFGRATRLAVHAWQLDAGEVPADGFATPGLLDRLGSRN